MSVFGEKDKKRKDWRRRGEKEKKTERAEEGRKAAEQKMKLINGK